MKLGDRFDTVLDGLCPMHLVLDAEGRISHAGPTFLKLRNAEQTIGVPVLDVLEVLRPDIGGAFDGLLTVGARRKLHMQCRTAPHTPLKGVFMPTAEGGGVLNLSFGISVKEAVGVYDLSSADFAPTDLTVEMLYLIEAKSAAMDASRTLNRRLEGAKIAAEEQAFTDTLTGLKNRRAMDFILDRLLGARSPFALMQVDLDFFKAVNDTMGHAAGDAVLQQAARELLSVTRGEDTVIRAGGDEFVILFHGITVKSRLADIAARLIEQLERPVPFEGQVCRISGSIGIACSTDYADPSAALLMAEADRALYASKNGGRGQYHFAIA